MLGGKLFDGANFIIYTHLYIHIFKICLNIVLLLIVYRFF